MPIQCSHGLGRWSAAAGVMGMWVRISLGAWISVFCDLRFSAAGRSLLPECGVPECDTDTSRMRAVEPEIVSCDDDDGRK